MLNTEAFEVRPEKFRDVDKEGYDGPRDPWSTDTLKAAKIFLWMFAVERMGSDAAVLHGSWSKAGLSKEAMLRCVEELLPHFAEEALAVLGHTRDKLPERLYDRLHKMYRVEETQAQARAAGRKFAKRKGVLTDKRVPKWLRKISVEHPTRSERLRHVWPKLQQAYRARRPLSRAQLRELLA